MNPQSFKYAHRCSQSLCSLVCLYLFWLLRLSCGMDQSAAIQPPESQHINTMFPGGRDWRAVSFAFLHSFVSSQAFFFSPTCVCAYIMCAQIRLLMPPASAECVAFPVRWCVRIAIGWLVSLRGSSGSKGRCSGAAGEEPLRGPPATVPSLWASSSERRLGCWEAAPGSWGPDAGKRCLGYKEEGCVCMCVCLFVFVCVLWGDPKQICLPVINSPDWHNSCRSNGKATAYVCV